MSNFSDLVKEANEKKKKEVENKEGKSTSSAFESLVKSANSGRVATSLTDTQVNEWLKSASEASKKAYDYLSADGYKTPDASLESVITELASSSKDVMQYIRANKSRYKDYETVYNSFVDAQNTITTLQKSMKGSNELFSNFETEEEYNNWSIGWLDEDAEATAEGVKARQDKYQSNKDRIAEIEREMDEIGFSWWWTDESDQKKALKAEKEKLEAENNQYDSIQGKTDKYYTPVTDEFLKNASYRDYTNASAEELWGYDAIVKDISVRNLAFDYDGNICDAGGNIIYEADHPVVKAMRENNLDGFRNSLVQDKLGMYFSASEDAKAEASNMLSSYGGTNNTWASLIQEGINNEWSQLTENEVNTYYNLLKTQGQEKAYQYLEDMAIVLTKRATEARATEISEADLLEQIAMNVASIPMNVFGGAVALIGDTANAIEGKEYNPYSAAHSWQNDASAIRQDTASDINEATNNAGLPWVGTTFGDVYQSLMSGADSMFAMYLPGSEYILGLNAASAEMKDLYERGASSEQMLAGGILSGVAEMFFEHYSIGELKKLKNMEKKAVRNLAEGFVRSVIMGGVEASEEMATEVANTIIDALVMGSQSDWKDFNTFAKNVVNAGIGGFVSGGAMGALGSTANYLQYNEKITQHGQKIIDNGGTDYLMELALEKAGVSKQTLKYAGKVKKDASATNVGKLSDHLEESIVKQNRSDIQKALVEKGLSEKDAKRVAEYLGSTESLTKEQKAEIEGNESIKAVVNELLSDPNASINKRGMNLAMARMGIETSTATEGSAQAHETPKTSTTTASEKEIATESKFETSEDGKTMLGDTEISIKEIASIKDGVMTLRLEDGSTVNAGDVVYSSDAMGLLYTNALEMGFNTVVANEFVKGYEGNMPVDKYAIDFLQAYRGGEYGIPKSELDKSASILPESVKNLAYDYGKADAKFKAAEKEKAKVASATKSEKATSKDTKKGKLHNTLTPTNETQRASLKTLGVIAEALGIDIYTFESPLINGKRQGANGWYDAKTNSIHIDLFAGAEGKGTMLFTAAHELTHHIREKLPTKFKAFADFLFEQYGEKNISVKELIADKIKSLEENGRTKGKTEAEIYDLAYEEVVADACESFLADGNAVAKIAELKAKDKTLWETIKDFFTKLVSRIKAAYEGLSPDSVEGRYVSEMLDTAEKLQKMWTEMLVEASEIVEIDTKTESVSPMFSERTWTESEYVTEREETAKKISKALGVDIKTAYKYIDDINGVARLIADDRARLDYEPNLDEKASVLKPNSEYKFSVDMSTLCAKRLLFTGTFDAIQKALPNMVFDSEDIVSLREMMQNRGYEVACGICYVESTRREIGRITQEFIDRYKVAQQTGRPISRINSSGKEVILKSAGRTFSADKNYTPNLGELNTTDIDIVKRDHREVYDAYLAFMNARGQAKPKLLETRAEYKGEILKHFKAKSSVEARNNAGGLRLQSFSDFEVPHMIDMMQIVMDMSRVGLKSQAYTKVPAFAEIFGDSGVKINLSLIAKGDGLDANDNLIFDDVEGINHKEAFKLRDKYSKNVGTILVGKTDAHIIAAMADPRIDYIIPFHKSSWKESLYDALGLTGYADYTDFQNEKPIDKDRKIKNFDPSEYWDFTKSGDENAQIYLEKCRDDGRIPKFPQFQGYPGYWKLLIDFKMYDNDGVGAPQEVVQPIFNTEASERILGEYKGGHKNFPVAKDVVEDFVKDHKDEVKYSDRYIAAKENPHILSMVAQVESGKFKANEKVFLGTVSNVVAEQIQKLTGINVKGFKIAVEARQIDHIIKDHGKNGKTDKSMANPSDIAKIEYAFDNYDEISLAGKTQAYTHMVNGRNKTADTVLYEKSIGEKSFYVVQAVPDTKAKTLYIVTAFIGKKGYKKEASQLINAKNLDVTSEIGSAITSDSIISQSDGNVNTKFSDRQKSSYTPTFYSYMGKVIDDIKLEKMGTSSILNHLKNRGVKDEEIKWSGIEAFLEGKKSVTKAELQEFVAGSQLVIEEEMSDPVTEIDIRKAEDTDDYVYALYDENGNIIDRFSYDYAGELESEKTGEAYLDLETLKDELRRDMDHTRWSQYKLDGGTNYRELVFKMPDSSYSNRAMRGHWGQDAEGILVHARIQDFEVDGKKMLFIEELQSDWHNEGMEKGYSTKEYEDAVAVYDKLADDYTKKRQAFNKYVRSSEFRSDPDDVSKKKFDWLRGKMETAEKRMQDAERDIEKLKAKGMGDVADAPFKDTYHEYVLKRLVRMAAEEGYDSIGWTPSWIQSDRWSEDYAEAYRIEYDQEMPKFLRKYGKKWGATVGKAEIGVAERTVNGEHYDAENIEVWSMDITDSMTESVLYEGQVMYSDRVTDKKTLNFLENQEHITTYKSFVEIDGKLYSPMATKVKGDDGKYHLTNPSELGVWQQAEEKPDSIPKFHKSGYGYYVLKKDDGGSVTAAYNPYEHSSNLVLNDQFESAYQRPNLVTVECIIPKSEMTSGYKAKYAKDSTGYLDWKSGTVAGKLKGNKRKVYLSRWLKPVRIVSDAEVASMYKDILGADISVPFNVVTPQLLTELEKVGVKIDYEGSPGYQYRQGKKAADVKYSDRNTASFNGKPFWSGSVSLLDGVIEEVHTMEEAEAVDFHHSMYFSQAQVEKMENGENAFFWVDKGVIQGDWRESVPKSIVERIREQIAIAPKYSDRSPDSVSNRSLLANALESVAQNDIEKNKLKEYKDKIALIESEQEKLSELREKIKELSFAKGARDTEAIKKLQFEANQTANRINTYDRQLLNLESTKALKGVLEREKKMAYKRAEQRGKEALSAYREKATKTQRELMTRYQESRKKNVEGRRKTEMRYKIKGVVNDLNQYLIKGTKDKHVPIELQKAVAEALSVVNMDTVGAEERLAELHKKLEKDPFDHHLLESYRRITEQGERMDKKLQALKNAYDDIVNSDDPLIANSHDEVISNSIDKVIKEVGDTPLRNMSLAQLEAVYDMYKMVLTTVRNANKAFKAQKSEDISVIANRVMEEIDKLGKKKLYVTKAGQVASKFDWNNLKPVYAFERIGSNTFTEVFNNVRAGEDTWAVDITEAKEFSTSQRKKFNYDSWDFNKRFGFTSTSGMNFELSLDQIMSLYAYSKREQAKEHLKRGGIVFDETTEVTIKTKFGIPVKFNPTQATAYNLSDETLANIIGKLTTEQMEFVDAMQDYLSTTMGDKGNEISLALYGVKLYKEKFYFPLKSATQFMAKAKEQQKGEVKIKNSGFSKETTPKASNPIVLTPFMDVWADHVNEMSMYHAFVLPLEDFYRVFNYKTPTSDTMATESVEMFLQNAFGKEATQYIDQLLKDLNGGARVDPRAGIMNALMGRFKKSAVFASASVVIQQPSAIARATALVDTKYFVGKPDKSKHKETWAEVKKYAPVAIIKEMGYFDTGMGQSTVEWIKDDNTFMDKVDDIASKAPALADEFGWCILWNAVKRETLHTQPKLQPNSEAFLKAVGERFTEVIVKTQVYDSVLARSGNMRSKDTGMKMATAFMGEPTTSINMLEDAILKAKRGDKKSAVRAVGAVVSSMILNSILVSIVYAGRDDDEEKTYEEKYISTLVEELLDSFNPLTLVPFLKDIVSIAQGYDVERSDMALITDLIDAWGNLESDNRSAYRKVEDFAGAIASLLGLPVKNVMRDARGMYNTINSFIKGEQTTGAGIKNAVTEALTGETKTKGEQLYEAIVSGDSAQIERVKGRFEDQDDMNTAFRKILKERYQSGEVSRSEALDLLITHGGYEEDDAYWKIEEWDFDIENGDEAEYQKYADFYEAVKTGKNLKAVIKEYTDHGVEPTTLASQITKYYKPLYREMSNSERAGIKGYLLNAYELLGYDRSKKSKDIDKWLED